MVWRHEEVGKRNIESMSDETFMPRFLKLARQSNTSNFFSRKFYKRRKLELFFCSVSTTAMFTNCLNISSQSRAWNLQFFNVCVGWTYSEVRFRKSFTWYRPPNTVINLLLESGRCIMAIQFYFCFFWFTAGNATDVAICWILLFDINILLPMQDLWIRLTDTK